MAVVVVGGHSRNIGKTSLMAGLIAALREMKWTAVKITQYGHGICSAHGGECDCAVDQHSFAISEERDRSGESDTSRFLVAGAARSLWVRTKQGMLGEAMPDIRRRLTSAENVIIESNSILRFLCPDVYLTVLDREQPDFKISAQEFLDRATAVVIHANGSGKPKWQNVSLGSVAGKPTFYVRPPEYCTPEIVEFVRERLSIAVK
jgi:molybdopterin-guanine dinucleotide biosynthesis protein